MLKAQVIYDSGSGRKKCGKHFDWAGILLLPMAQKKMRKNKEKVASGKGEELYLPWKLLK